MTHPTLEDAARAAFEGFGGADVASGKSWEQQTEHFREHFRTEARAVLLSIRPPDGFEVTLKEQMAREYIDAVLRSGE